MRAQNLLFHVHKCNEDTCQYHGLSTSGEITALGHPVLVQGQDGKEHYERGSDPEEKFMSSKLHDPSTRSHGMKFSPTAQTAFNVGTTIRCMECGKPRLMHAAKKLTISEKNALKRVLNDFQYVCGTILQDIQSDERNSDLKVIEKVFCCENIAPT